MEHRNNQHWDGEAGEFLSLVKRYHKGQKRASGEQWEHCDAVARELDEALALEPGLSSGKRRELLLGALGHDLYEDSDIRPEEVIATYGQGVHDRIMGVTNTEGDDRPAKYIKHLGEASEEDRLIKLADLIDNYGGVARSIEKVGREWVTGWFLPLVEPMYARVSQTTFSRFPRAAEFLLRRAAGARQELLHLVTDVYDVPGFPASMPLGSPSAEPVSPETEREPWDFQAFRRHYNDWAKRYTGWDLEDKPGLEDELKSFYSGSDVLTLEEYARIRFLTDQQT